MMQRSSQFEGDPCSGRPSGPRPGSPHRSLGAAAVSRSRRPTAPIESAMSCTRVPVAVALSVLLGCSSPGHELLSSFGAGGAGATPAGGAPGIVLPVAGAPGGAPASATGGAAGSALGTGGIAATRCRYDRDCSPPALCVAGTCQSCDSATACTVQCPADFRTVRLSCSQCGCSSVASCQDDADCIDPRRPEDVCHEAPDGSRLCGHRDCPNLTADLVAPDLSCPLACVGCRCGLERSWYCGATCVSACVP